MAGDFDKDGRPDLLVANQNSRSMTLLLGLSSGTFSSPITIPTVFDNPGQLELGDLNSDGNLDVVLGTDSGFSGFLGNGDSTFLPEVATYANIGNASIAIGDANGDAKLDLLTGNGNGDVTVWLGNGDGTFAASQDYGVGGVLGPLRMADLTGDGRPDIAAIANSSWPGRLVILKNMGSFIPTGVPASELSFNGEAKLEPGYPNPARYDVSFRYLLSRPTVVQFSIFDVLGRRVATLAGGEQSTGWHAFSWDRHGQSRSRVAAGVYFAELRTMSTRSVRKIILVN